jgi:hypothetical protein
MTLKIKYKIMKLYNYNTSKNTKTYLPMIYQNSTVEFAAMLGIAYLLSF